MTDSDTRPPTALPPPDRLRVLQNIIAAQRWDIEGLTAQRDKALADLAALRAAHEALAADLAQDAVRRAEQVAAMARRTETDSVRADAASAAQRATRDFAASLVAGQIPMPPEYMAEALLLQASGMFDAGFYARQIPECTEIGAALVHYISEGEAAGQLAHPLFLPDFYSALARQNNLPTGWMFRTALAHYAAFGAAAHLPPGPLADPDFCGRQAGLAGPAEPLTFWRQAGLPLQLAPHALIDLTEYRRRRPELAADADPLADYLLHGLETGVAPVKLFDMGWYRQTYHDVRDANDDPLLHYLLYGDSENRQPNALFQPALYRRLAGDPPAGMTTLEHYIRHRPSSGLRTHPLFDGAYYLARNPDVAADARDPLAHCLLDGSTEDRVPHPLFAPAYVRRRYPTISGRHGSPLVGFLSGPEHLRGESHPLFDPAWYSQQAPDALDWPGGIQDHYLHFGADNLADPHPLFCTRYYLEQLAAMTGQRLGDCGGRSPLEHYLAGGWQQGLRPHPLFDPDLYLRENRDIVEIGIEPLTHFVEIGGSRAEHRRPHLLFDILRYGAATRDLVGEDENLLADYLRHWQQRPDPLALFNAAHYLRALRQSGAEARHANPLCDYAWAGVGAAAPHPLFDPDWYRAHAAVPPDWRRSLLEHFLLHGETQPGETSQDGPGQDAAPFMPHPALDAAHVAAQLVSLPPGSATLLELYAAHAARLGLDAHILAPGRDSLLRRPELAAPGTGTDPLSDWIARHGPPDWALPGPLLRAQICGIGGVGPVNPDLAHGLPIAADPPSGDGTWLISGKLTGKRRRRLAICLVHQTEAAAPLHLHLMQSLRAAGCAILLVDAAHGVPQPPAAALAAAADLHLAHSQGGGLAGSLLLACRLFATEIAAFRQIVVVSDNLVGPLGPMQPLWQSLDAIRGGWWAATGSSDDLGAAECSFFAFDPALLRSPPLEALLADLTAARHAGLAEARLCAAFTEAAGPPALFATPQALRAAWQESLPDLRAWARELGAGRPGWPTGGDAALAARLGGFAQDWLAMAAEDAAMAHALRPAHVYFAPLLAAGMPFIRRDLLLANPVQTPQLLSLPDLLPAPARATLAQLLRPLLPSYPPDLAPLLRLSDDLLDALCP